MEIRLLGPVELRLDRQVVDAGPPQQRHVLAVLAADAGRTVTSELLIDRVWDEAPPGARRTLHVYLTRLRRLLAGGAGPVLLRRSGGYALDVPAEQVDLNRFRDLVEQARGRRDDDGVGLLRRALRLWTGEPLAGLPGSWAERMRRAWRRQYVDALVQWAEAELRCGNGGAVLAPLTEAIGEYPLVEPLTAALMRALHLTGRTVDALDCYAELRQRLVEELGADPSPEVRDAYRAILRNEAPDGKLPGPAWRAPAQLPADVPGFVARAPEQARLDDALDGGAPAAVVVLSGSAGVGKTALAVHWAHRVRDRFPDGQIYLDLRGFGAGAAPMSSAEAVLLGLDALGVPAETVPSEPPAATALYRTLVADRRMLILLDNARDAAQVRPLLPGTHGCLVVVTSRDQLTGLAAAEGARPVPIALFSPEQARQFLAGRLGTDRVAAEPDAAGLIAERCARLPLALGVVAGRAAAHPDFPLARWADELVVGRLDVLGAGDPATDVRNVFSWSYRALHPPAAQLFRLLALCPGPDAGAAAAASLAGLPAERTRSLLADLTRAHLLSEHRPGRYAMHDLLRTYAAELTASRDSDGERAAALGRVIDHYVYGGQAAALQLHPHRVRVVADPAPDGVLVEACTGERAALRWVAEHRPAMLAAAGLAVEAGFARRAWQLARVLAGLLHDQGRWHDLSAVGRLAIRATEQLGEDRGRAWALRLLGCAHAHLRRFGEAETAYRAALEGYERLGDTAGRAGVYYALARLAESRGEWPVMRERSAHALRLYTEAGHRVGRARALNLVGWVHARHREWTASLTHCERALAIQDELDDRSGQAATLDSIGYVHHHRGEYADATRYYERALALCRRCGDRFNETKILTHLGHTHAASGRPDAAQAAWRVARQILADLGDAGPAAPPWTADAPVSARS
ncbi:tetratricopeptide repeat protein [Dactylosporangium vinaceum]|uniref:BTAD domain-containing putative transcriptional regulator n=1 Tax=Dactylosporangium vinaceum TaxID=53362 RepID=A0ABV5MAW1_9ACTN|nr:BTAD domain-containing putative transcriptional regulator [Dactylosporangium vinaceum]UAB92854.1 tetratricopeptide repeat protein [Dactylosporangium vinaceum]